jgi:hypothetical protein
MPRLRVVARKHAARSRGGDEEYRLTLTFRWPNGHTMSFVANDTVTAPLMHRTIMPALKDAFPIDVHGVPTIQAVHHRTILATPTCVRAVAGGPRMPGE